jgi:hypothetical protein
VLRRRAALEHLVEVVAEALQAIRGHRLYWAGAKTEHERRLDEPGGEDDLLTGREDDE